MRMDVERAITLDSSMGSVYDVEANVQSRGHIQWLEATTQGRATVCCPSEVPYWQLVSSCNRIAYDLQLLADSNSVLRLRGMKDRYDVGFCSYGDLTQLVNDVLPRV